MTASVAFYLFTLPCFHDSKSLWYVEYCQYCPSLEIGRYAIFPPSIPKGEPQTSIEEMELGRNCIEQGVHILILEAIFVAYSASYSKAIPGVDH